MIVYDLHCAEGHRFEGWFGSSADYVEQREQGLVECPQCGSQEVAKAPMAPAVPAKSNQRTGKVVAKPGKPVTNREIPPEVHKAMRALAEAQAKALRTSTYVGDGFAEESRAMHYGEKEVEAIHGKATVREAKELIEEGIAVAPLPFPIAEPEKLN
jgi:hypothetical protein